jgi:hypothetical protein
MKDWTRLTNRTFRIWLDTMQAGAAAWTTVAMRLPMLTAKGASSPEASRMVEEKVAAVTEGAMKASLTGAALVGRAMGPLAVASGAVSIADALARPARRRVKANAKRLTKPRKVRPKKR